jgi:hypothetical protein
LLTTVRLALAAAVIAAAEQPVQFRDCIAHRRLVDM